MLKRKHKRMIKLLLTTIVWSGFTPRTWRSTFHRGCMAVCAAIYCNNLDQACNLMPGHLIKSAFQHFQRHSKSADRVPSSLNATVGQFDANQKEQKQDQACVCTVVLNIYVNIQGHISLI